MGGKVNILGFDETYRIQTYYQDTDYEWIDLSDVRNTNCCCTTQSLTVIRDRLQKRQHKGITFIGSGNYHYVTYLLLAEVELPFSLILFDYHTDMIPSLSHSLLSCGSWLFDAIEKVPILRKVLIIGAKNNLTAAIPAHYSRLVSAFAPSHPYPIGELKKTIIDAIPTSHVYISIDKDVLSRSEAVTNWDQGNMSLTKLLDLLEYIGKAKVICGIDVCGEYYVPLVDSFRRESLLAARINDRANRIILETTMKLKVN